VTSIVVTESPRHHKANSLDRRGITPFNSSRCKAMTVFVVVIKDKGIVALTAERRLEAEERVCDRIFRDDLMVLESGGLPLWDGVTDIQIRDALPHEEEKWRSSYARAMRNGSIDGGDDTWIAFLVPLADRERQKR
jgi:hypothetical protein